MITFFARHPTAANLLMLAIILVGLVGAVGMTRELFPEFVPGYINVRVVYPGASAEEIENTICERIENEVESVEGVTEIKSVAQEGVALVTIEVTDGYSLNGVLDDVRNAVEQIDNFPEQTERPLVWELKPVESVSVVSVSGDMEEKDLYALADSLKRELLDLDEVSQVVLGGFSEHQIRIEVREDALRAYGLTIADVAGQVRQRSIDLPAGSVETENQEIKIRVVDQRRWAEDFRDLTVLSSATGARVPLRAVAEVSDVFEDDWARTTFNGVRSANLLVQKADQEDIITVSDAVARFVAQRVKSLPPGVTLEAWGDWSTSVRDRLRMLVGNGVWGFALVFLTLWLFLNLRLSFWVAVGVPISFLGALFAMWLLGMTLNMITMFSLIMVLGIVVDDAIVIGENIYAKYVAGVPPAQAAIEGTREVAPGVIASMLTTVAVFLPLLLMAGEIGKVMRVLPVGVIVALAVSLVEAFLVLPNHLAHSLGKMPKQPARLRRWIDRQVQWVIDDVYGPWMARALRHRAIVIASVVMLLLIAIGLLAGRRVQFEPFPKLDNDFLLATVIMPQGTDQKNTAEVVRRIEEQVATVNDHYRDRQSGGANLVRHYSTTYGSRFQGDDRGSHVAEVTVELVPADYRQVRSDDVIAYLKEHVGDVADVETLTIDQVRVTPGGKAIEIELRGDDLGELQTASQDLRNKLASYPGVLNLTDDLRPGKPEMLVRGKPRADALGITQEMLAAQLQNAFWGSIAEEFLRGSDTFEVRVRLADRDRNSLADLEDFRIVTPLGQRVPFYEVADAELTRGYSKIVRIDRRRTVTVTADVDTAGGNAEQIIRNLQSNYLGDFRERHPGVSVRLQGQNEETYKTMRSVATGFLIGLAIIYLILSYVFRSYIEPLIVMSAIPFGLIGAIFGHLLLGYDWTIPSTVGFVSLSGIVVNDSIVLIEFIKNRMAEGIATQKAIWMAGRQRFRAVILTSATTAAGLLPVLLERSLQAQFLIPMAVSISFGLMFATVLVLVLIPCLYSLLDDFGYLRHNKHWRIDPPRTTAAGE